MTAHFTGLDLMTTHVQNQKHFETSCAIVAVDVTEKALDKLLSITLLT